MEQPKKSIPEKLDAKEIITLTARLAQLMAEEVDLLGNMKVKKIQELQAEKLFLVNALETYRKKIAKHPHLSETIPSQDKRDLESVVDIFNDILEENHRKLQMAREVNRHIVDAITDVVKEKTSSKVYSGKGTPGALGSESLSITLNQTA